MNIQNRIIEIVNSHDYEKEIEELVSSYENNPIKEGETIPLQPIINSEFIGDEEEIAQKVAKQIMQYRIKEKAFMKLIAKGIIHPIELGDGQFNQDVKYTIKSSMVKSEYYYKVYFPRSIFTKFTRV